MRADSHHPVPPAQHGGAALAGYRLAALFAHPDDEAYAAAGTLALCARSGAQVTVLCATRGEQGLAGLAARGAELAALRTEELRRSCALLGLATPRFLDLPDGRLDDEDASAVVERLVVLLRSVRPHALLTLGPDGAYGHLDHLTCTAWLTAAANELDPGAQSRLLHVAFPPGLMLPLYRTLRRLRRKPVADLPAETFGIEPAQADLCIALGELGRTKLAAIAAHRSQRRDEDPRSFLWPGLVDALCEQECFTLARGPRLPPGAPHPFVGLAR